MWVEYFDLLYPAQTLIFSYMLITISIVLDAPLSTIQIWMHVVSDAHDYKLKDENNVPLVAHIR